MSTLTRIIDIVRGNAATVTTATKLSDLGYSSDAHFSGLAKDLRNEFGGDTPAFEVATGKELKKLLGAAGGLTVGLLRDAVDERMRGPITKGEITKRVRSATKKAWGGTTEDQAKSFADRGKDRKKIKNLESFIVDAFLPLIGDIITKSELNSPNDSNDITTIIEPKFRAAGR